MRNLNPTSQSQLKSRMLVLMLALSMLAVAAPCVTQCVAQVSAPLARKVQSAERQSRDAIRLSQRLYRFYKLSTQQTGSAQSTN
jgi:hypothetical protein